MTEPRVFDKQKLVEAAKKVVANAYAPYSGVRVGAALLDSDGEIFVGCNVENASYGLTVCAERICVFNAVSHGSTRFVALCVVIEGKIKPVPCGACRQVLAEFVEDLEVIGINSVGETLHTSLRELLPESFRLSR